MQKEQPQDQLRTQEGNLVNQLIHEYMHLEGHLRTYGEKISGAHGQSAARWRVMGAITEGPLTVSKIARRMGIVRQAVFRTMNILVDEGLVFAEKNVDHATSPLYSLTEKGWSAMKKITRDQIAWSNDLGKSFRSEELSTAIDVLKRLSVLLDGVKKV